MSIGGVHGDRERESYGGWKEDNDFFFKWNLMNYWY